jgi:hypothetical protein
MYDSIFMLKYQKKKASDMRLHIRGLLVVSIGFSPIMRIFKDKQIFSKC